MLTTALIFGVGLPIALASGAKTIKWMKEHYIPSEENHNKEDTNWNVFNDGLDTDTITDPAFSSVPGNAGYDEYNEFMNLVDND